MLTESRPRGFYESVAELALCVLPSFERAPFWHSARALHHSESLSDHAEHQTAQRLSVGEADAVMLLA
jgi:hypothetical protein